jgi:transposase-like protein
VCGAGETLLEPRVPGSRLRRMVEMAQESMKTRVREITPLPQTQRVDRRLSPETIAELVQAYRDGVGTPELRRRYGLSQGSVIKTLHSHGVEMRGQGLADSDVSVAAELYRSGAALAQLSERFGVSPNAVRRALVSAGMVMRPRGGSKPRR